MAIPKSYKDREHQSFEESPDASNLVARRVKVTNDSNSPVPISGNITTTAGGAESEKITNLSLPTINTEVAHLLQNNLSEIILRSRVSAELKLAFVSTESGTKYITLNAGCTLSLDGLKFTGKTIYIQSPVVATVEILELYT